MKSKAFKTPEFKVLIYFIGKALSATVSLAIIPLFIKWFGDENYAKYIIIYVTFLIFISGTIGWINQSIIKFHGDYKDRNSFYNDAHKINFRIASLLTIPLLITIYFSTKPDSILLFLIIGLTFITACSYTSRLVQEQAEMNSIKYSLSEIIRLVVFLSFSFFLKEINSISALEVIFIALFFSYLTPLLFLKKRLNLKRFKINTKIDYSLTKKFLRYGLPLSVWMVFSPSANGIEKYILNYFVTASVLTKYVAVYDVVFKIFSQLVNPVNRVFQPLLMNINSSGNKELFNKTIKKGLLYLILIFLPALLLFYYFQDFILINYLGFKDIENLKLLKKVILPLAFSAIIWQIAIIWQKGLEAKEKTKLLAFYIILISIISSLFSIWLLPIYNFTILAYVNLGASIGYFLLIYFTNKYVEN